MKNHPLIPSTEVTRPILQSPFRLLILFASMLIVVSSGSAVTLPYYDGFDYPEGALHTVGSPTWFTSSGGVEVSVSNSAALTAPAGYPAATGKGVRRSSSGTSRRSVVQFTQIPAVDGNVMYASFLLSVQTVPTAAVVFVHMDDGSASAGSPQCGIFVDGSSKLGVAINNSAPQFTMASGLSAGTHLVVVKYTFQSGNDRADLWVDPSSTDYGAGTAPAPLGGANNANPTTPLEYLHIVAPSSGGGTVFVDELRLGTNWADVVPAGGPLVGAKLGFTTQPAGAAPNATLSPVVVQVQTAGGASVASNGVPVTLTLTAGSGTLNGTVTQNTDSSGKATFSNLSIDTVGTGKQLTATASGIGTGLTNAISTTFTIADPSVATKLAFTSQPTDRQVNVVMSSVVVQVQDASSVAVSTNGVPVTLNLSSGTGVLNGTLTQNTDGTGKATFSNLSVDTAGTGKQLTASASGLTSATSSTFAITNGGGGGGGSPGLNISQTRMLPSGYEVKGTNGTPVTFAQIIGSPSLTLPLTNWLLVAYDNLDGSGNITFTNPTSIAMPLAYYRLRTGNTVTKLEPPSIPSVTAPQSQIVSPGATATFTVGATGPLLQYLWLFNNVPIKNATNTSLIISNAQAGNVGNYQVIVANPGGSVTSPIATLGVGNVGPTITMQPQPQTNNAGGTAIFTIAATGTAPLSYQWYTNVSTPLTDKTNTQLILPNLTTNDVANYRCVVTNPYGVAPSLDAHLTVNPVPTGLPDTNVLGWAQFAGVTGGAGGTEVTVSDYTALRAACRAAGPIIIHVVGTITPNEDYCYIEGRDKTIVGVGTNAGLSAAGFRPAGTNIIIANMSFNSFNPNSDGVTIDGNGHGVARNVWVDHCTFYDSTDGSVDVTKGADYVTVSWCKFYYAPVPTGTVNHEFVNLIGSSDTDNPGGVQYHVTFHHNWYSSYCRERMPSVRFGHVHVFNNYYDCFDNNYCVRTRINAEVLVENNYFINVHNPWERFVTSGADGKLFASGNITNNCTFVSGWVSGAVVIPGNDVLGSDLNPPPYSYTLTPAADVPFYSQTYCGSGKYPYAP